VHIKINITIICRAFSEHFSVKNIIMANIVEAYNNIEEHHPSCHRAEPRSKCALLVHALI